MEMLVIRDKEIGPEIIDWLQGRISSSVYVNHYHRPDINEIITKRIRSVLGELINYLRRRNKCHFSVMQLTLNPVWTNPRIHNYHFNFINKSICQK